MILEIAQIDVKPGSESEFEAGIEKASAIFRQAEGCRGFEVRRSVEKPQCYRLLIQWDSVEVHTEAFTGSQAWKDYRALVSDTFADKPQVEHTELVLKAF